MPVPLINACAHSPLGLIWQTAKVLPWIDQAHFQGLAYIRLEDRMPNPDHGAPEWAQNASDEHAHVYGWYDSSAETGMPHIVLYVEEIYGGFPRLLWWSPLPTLRIARSLAHEIAHHLAATRRYIFELGDDLKDEQLLANRYANSVIERMTGRKIYRIAQWFLKDIAEWHYALGCADWRAEKFDKAAKRFYNAWDLDPSNEEAAYWYWRAHERLSGS